MGNLNTDGTSNTIDIPSGNTHTANTLHQLPTTGNGSSPTNQPPDGLTELAALTSLLWPVREVIIHDQTL